MAKKWMLQACYTATAFVIVWIVLVHLRGDTENKRLTNYTLELLKQANASADKRRESVDDA